MVRASRTSWPNAPRPISRARANCSCDGSRAALDHAGIPPRDVDVVVTVSSTGIATPSLEARVAPRWAFADGDARAGVRPRMRRRRVRADARCAACARRAGRSRPGGRGRTCTLAFRSDRGIKADVVTRRLFGDGAAAAVLRAGPATGRLRIGAAAEHTWPDTLDIMGWMIDPVGFRRDAVALAAAFRRTEPGRAGAAFVAQGCTAPHSSAIRAARKCWTRSKVALELQKGTLRDEREVLRSYGNMSAPTVLFVLERALQARPARRRPCCRRSARALRRTLLALEAAHG